MNGESDQEEDDGAESETNSVTGVGGVGVGGSGVGGNGAPTPFAGPAVEMYRWISNANGITFSVPRKLLNGGEAEQEDVDMELDGDDEDKEKVDGDNQVRIPLFFRSINLRGWSHTQPSG